MKGNKASIIIGAQWGDEGKGRIVDVLSSKFDIIVRFQGGNNAGHSLHFDKTSLVLHLIPCGIVRQKIAVIGNGVVLDPEVLFSEIKSLESLGFSCSPEYLKIAYKCHIILPWHKGIDSEREAKSESHIGTTKRGIGPCYEDKVARSGIRALDLLSSAMLERRLAMLYASRNLAPITNELFKALLAYGERLKPYLIDVGDYLEKALEEGQGVLYEGAQGSLLDIDHGSYPYVTSSSCLAAQASLGSGIGLNRLGEVILVSKGYSTRVGDGPFPTELDQKSQEILRAKGNEFGATTGRSRRIGWLDLVALGYACRINGATALILTKLDILADMPIRIACAYQDKNGSLLSFEQAMRKDAMGESFSVVYEEIPSFTNFPEKPQCLEDLPLGIQELCKKVEKSLKVPLRMISFGKERGLEIEFL